MPQPIGACRTDRGSGPRPSAEDLSRSCRPDCDDVVARRARLLDARNSWVCCSASPGTSACQFTGLVDSAVAASRRPYPGRELWNLDLTLHDVDPHVASVRTARRPSASAHRLDGCRRGGARSRLRRSACPGRSLRTSRFDPLHDARERAGPLWPACRVAAPSCAGANRRELALDFGGNDFTRVGAGRRNASASRPAL